MPVRVGCPKSTVYGSGDQFEKGWNLLRGRKLLIHKTLPDPVQIGPDVPIPCADLTASSLIVRCSGSALGKYIFDTFPAVTLVWHQKIRKFRMEALAIFTAETAKEKGFCLACIGAYFSCFPVIRCEFPSANRTTQKLRPRNNKNSLSHFLVKLDTITTLQ